MAIIGFEPLDADACWSLAASVPVGRMLIDTGEHRAILPVLFAVHAREVIFRTAPGDKLVAAALHRRTVFEVDDWNADTHTGWSVNVNGTLSEVTDHDEIADLERFALPVWAAPDARNRWVKITADHISGRRIAPTGD